MDPSELEPFAKPEAALTEALALLADDDWYVQTSYAPVHCVRLSF